MQDCTFSRCMLSTAGTVCLKKWSVNAFKRHLELLRQRRWVSSWTLCPRKPLIWLLVHARYNLTFVVRCVMIAIGAATPGKLPSMFVEIAWYSVTFPYFLQ